MHNPRIGHDFEDYDFDNLGRGMEILIQGLEWEGQKASAKDRILTFNGHEMDRYSVVVKIDAHDEFGFEVDVKGHNLCTYWRRKDGTYNWKKIVERIRQAAQIQKQTKAYEMETRIRLARPVEA